MREAAKKPTSTGPTQRYHQFGPRVRLHRQRLGWTQQELAQRAGVATQEALARIETGQSLPRLDHAYGLASAMNVSLDELMGGSSGTHVIHYHQPGEMRVSVTNGGLVILGNYGPAELEHLMERWQHWRDTTPARDDAAAMETSQEEHTQREAQP